MKIAIKKTSLLLGIVISLTVQSCTSPEALALNENFSITDSLISKLLIDTVQQANNRTELDFSAKITADEELRTAIFPMVSGMVQGVNVKLGDKVNKGQVLATMASSEMAGFDKEAISAAAELSNAARNVKQVEEMFKSGLSAARELEEAKNDYLVKQAEDKRAKAILKLNGGNNNGNYNIKSPLTGFIIEKNISSGMQVRADNDKNLFTIADLSVVSVMINIYESDIARIKEGDELSIAILSYPEKEFTGRIDKIYNMIDNESKVMNARVSISNPGYLLKPGMMATVKISAKSGINLPVVNSRGIVFDENKNYVLVLDTNNKVQIREIEIGRKTAERAYISKGLKAGDRIVASKQVFLYESLKNQG